MSQSNSSKSGGFGTSVSSTAIKVVVALSFIISFNSSKSGGSGTTFVLSTVEVLNDNDPLEVLKE
eukprot:15356948-Ditylum_brightwellii.AAC.1